MEAFDTWRSQAETSRAKPVEIKAWKRAYGVGGSLGGWARSRGSRGAGAAGHVKRAVHSLPLEARRLGSPKAAAGGLPKAGECPRGHALKACMPGRASEFESHRCDFCRRHSICAPELVHRCESCDYDLCAACAGDQRATEPFPAPKRSREV